MKFICSSQTLSEACMNVQRATSSKSSNLPTIEGILIKAANDKVMLTGYDLEVGIITSVEARVEQAGSIILNAKILCDILRNAPDSLVSIECDERLICKIKSGDSEFSIIGLSEADYPELPSVSGGFPIVVGGEILKDMIKKTIFAAAENDSKLIHTGIRFEITDGNIRLVSVDGYKLAIRNEKIDYHGDEKNFVVPKKTLNEVIKLINDSSETVSMVVAQRHILFECGTYVIISRLLEGEFLSYKSAIPNTAKTEVKVNTRSIINSIERASLIITERIKSYIRCIFDEGSIRISSTTALGSANDRIIAETQGERVEIGFNNKYLLDALRVCDTDEIILRLNGPTSPIIMVPNDSESLIYESSFLFMVLPVRMN
ncbi:MAG: DNA polymerase III subunit beta [Oscillospiraceae bacterium]|nr:DNA polymerase III subunit beta [Oscillospiraceae bacterium]